MRRTLTIGAVALLIVAGCSDDSEPTTEASSAVTTTGSTTAGSATTESATSTTTVPARSSTTSPSTTATVSPSSSTPRTTIAARPARPTTTGAPTTADSTTPDSGVVDDNVLSPVFVTFDVTPLDPCPAPGDSVPLPAREVIVTWEVIGVDSVYVAIDDLDVPYAAGLPAAGSIALPNICPGGNTYFVVAENPDARAVREATR